jgi:hypothetical protein
MKNVIVSILLVVAVMALGAIAYASVAVKSNGTQVGVAEAINVVNTGTTTTSFDGYNLTLSGVNWTSANQVTSANVN